MSQSGLFIEDGKIEIVDGGRVTFTTDGTLVNLLPASYDLNLNNIDLSFPDFTKSDAYYWSGGARSTSYYDSEKQEWVWRDYRSEGCSTSITVVPQEWNNFSNPIVLGPLPAEGIDFLDILAYPRRTNTPSNWMGQAIPVPIPQNQWVDMGGASMIVEQALGMTRAVTPAISGGNVVLLAQQSVSNAPTGYTTNPAENKGVTYGPNGQGLPVSARDFKEYIDTIDTWGIYFYRRNGGNPCATSDNTNYASNWRFDFRIAFGRRT